jgi:hypothetical protein
VCLPRARSEGDLVIATIALDRQPGRFDGGAAKQPPARTRRWMPWAVIGVGVIALGYGLTTIPLVRVSQFGLLATASPLYGTSLLLATVAFAVSVRQSNMAAAVAATVFMIAVQRLPSAVCTDYPMYAWTYKHLGVVDYIQHSHSLARGVDIYNSWPGSFAITAWFSDLTGMAPTTFAHWFAPLFHLALGGLTYAAARAWGLRQLPAITAVFLVVTMNWVGQDYFSPQGMTILLTTALFIVVGLSRDRPIGFWLIVILFTAATISHQLTPFSILITIGLLVVGRRMKPWWIIFPLAAIALSFLLYNWDEASKYQLFSFNLTKNADGNIPTVGSLGQQITSYGVRTLSGTMWLATAIVLIVRWRQKQPFWALAVLALSPMLILGGQNYGGEAIFRVFLYSLVGCSIVLGPVVVSFLQGKWLRYSSMLIALLVGTTLAAQGYTGGWYANVMPKEQVYTSQMVLSQAELPAYLTPVAPVWPQRGSWHYVDYAKFDEGFDYPMIFAADLVGSHFDTDADYQKFLEAASNRTDATTYLIITEQTRMYAWYFGILPWDALPNLQRHLANDPRWEPLYHGQGIAVYVHRVKVR